MASRTLDPENQDPDDIFRDIDLDDEEEVADENGRLIKKRKGYRSNFTLSVNSINNLITASRFENGTVKKSQANKEALLRAREKLEVRYEKLQALNNRQLVITQDVEVEDVREAGYYQGNIDNAAERYNQVIRDLAKLEEAIHPQPNWNDDNHHNEQPNQLKPIQALKPSFTLSFDNSPTELVTWGTQFQSYFDASKFQNLPVAQQQAFLRQGLHPDVWSSIQHKINNQTPVFPNPFDLEEESCQGFIEEAFQIQYPLIMRRYELFTYKRQGNQTFTNFYAKLKEQAGAAQLDQMDMNDYLIFLVIAGVNDMKIKDKILSIPRKEFNLEEVHRVATACEAAKNYSITSPDSAKNNAQIANKISVGKFLKKPQSNFKDSNVVGSSKIKAMKDGGLCIRCTMPMHNPDETCPHLKTKCHYCGAIGHIQRACSQNPMVISRTVNKSMVTYNFKPAELQTPP